MNNLQVFNHSEFGELKIFTLNGKEYFPATACAKVLGYTNPQKAIRDHCKGVNESFTPTPGGKQKLKIIPEGDLYRLIARSNLPASEKFERWVFDEVIPSIRRTGTYTMPTVDPNADGTHELEFKVRAGSAATAIFLEHLAGAIRQIERERQEVMNRPITIYDVQRVAAQRGGGSR